MVMPAPRPRPGPKPKSGKTGSPTMRRVADRVRHGRRHRVADAEPQLREGFVTQRDLVRCLVGQRPASIVGVTGRALDPLGRPDRLLRVARRARVSPTYCWKLAPTRSATCGSRRITGIATSWNRDPVNGCPAPNWKSTPHRPRGRPEVIHAGGEPERRDHRRDREAEPDDGASHGRGRAPVAGLQRQSRARARGDAAAAAARSPTRPATGARPRGTPRCPRHHHAPTPASAQGSRRSGSWWPRSPAPRGPSAGRSIRMPGLGSATRATPVGNDARGRDGARHRDRRSAGGDQQGGDARPPTRSGVASCPARAGWECRWRPGRCAARAICPSTMMPAIAASTASRRSTIAFRCVVRATNSASVLKSVSAAWGANA